MFCLLRDRYPSVPNKKANSNYPLVKVVPYRNKNKKQLWNIVFQVLLAVNNGLGNSAASISLANCTCLIAAVSLSNGSYLGALLFYYNSKNLNCIGALSFFVKICSHFFMIFEVK